MNTQEKSIINIGVPSFVFLIFLTLKLAEIGQVAYWSWWWVTSPIWIPAALVVAVLIGLGIAALVAYFMTKGKDVNSTVETSLKNLNNPPKTSRFQQRLDEMNRQRESNKLRK